MCKLLLDYAATAIEYYKRFFFHRRAAVVKVENNKVVQTILLGIFFGAFKFDI